MPSEDTQFKPGQSGNPAGRPKGSRNKLSQAFIDALYGDFSEHGEDALLRLRMEQPGVYARVIASLIPKELDVNMAGEIGVRNVTKQYVSTSKDD